VTSGVIRHDSLRNRFTLDRGGAVAYITYREVDAHTLDLDHTFVPPALRGGGIASQLTEHALRYARARGARVIASCPFVATYLARHPEHRDLAV
jgi:predicted GNAT family acetyltransferase